MTHNNATFPPSFKVNTAKTSNLMIKANVKNKRQLKKKNKKKAKNFDKVAIMETKVKHFDHKKTMSGQLLSFRLFLDSRYLMPCHVGLEMILLRG